jgi:hypothetical protein
LHNINNGVFKLAAYQFYERSEIDANALNNCLLIVINQ